MPAKPRRMQVSRKKGFNLQEESRELNGLEAKLVTRPGKFGNPFSIADVAKIYKLDKDAAQAKAVAMAGQWLRGTLDKKLVPYPPPSRAEIRDELQGYNLACWCKPDQPCHAEVLLEIANGK
jgi:hypothetical protein